MTIDPARNGVVLDEPDPASLYARLETDRQEFLDRARENAQLTIPSIMPPEGHAPGQRLTVPYQSIGSHGVNTLTAKLVMTILPANAPMFRLSVTDKVVEELTASEMRSGVEKKLNEIERSVMDEIEGLGVRAALTEAVKHLIVCGNVLIYVPPKGNLRIFRLDRYVVQRDFEGSLLRVIIKETVSRETLPADVQALIAIPGDGLPSSDSRVDEKEVDLYTVFERDGPRIRTYQWVKGVTLPKSQGSWPVDKAPIMPLRWSYLHDEDYGRAYVDEYIGDLTGSESLSRSIREAAAAAAKVNPLVSPTGLTRAQDIANAENLEVISGRADDVTMLQFDKQADMQVAQTVLQDLIQRLSHAFMMNKAIQRSGERVTAEEIRTMISDIDDVLGGVYSLLAQELQLPLVVRLMDRMVREKKIPDVQSIKGQDGKPVAAPKVVTGIEALGRGHDFNKYMTFAREIVLPLKEVLAGEMNFREFAERAGISLSIDTDGLFKSEEQKLQEQQKMQQAAQGQMLNEALQSAVKGGVPPLAKAAADSMVGTNQPQEGSA